ncbi:hypothetical protein Tco_1401993 [Tanacetum coccineum]
MRYSQFELRFLAKPAKSEGFEQVVDFLNAHTIKYALTINPIIYTSCIEQFWATLKVKMVNREQHLQALVDGKKIVVTEASLRRDLQLDDGEGTDCLPNATSFEELIRMGRPKEKDTQVPQSSVPSNPTNVADEDSMTLKELMDFYTKLSVSMVSSDEASLGDPSISLVQDKGTSWIQEDAETRERTSADTEILLDQEEPTELVEDPGSGEKGEKEISTAEVLVSTASSIPEVSTVIPERQVYIRRNAEKRKDKGKAIMKDDESVQKKTKKQLEQERLGHEEAIRPQEQINEEERQKIARDAKIAKQLQEEIDIARQEQEKYDLAQALELQKELDKRKEGVAETTQA